MWCEINELFFSKYSLHCLPSIELKLLFVWFIGDTRSSCETNIDHLVTVDAVKICMLNLIFLQITCASAQRLEVNSWSMTS